MGLVTNEDVRCFVIVLSVLRPWMLAQTIKEAKGPHRDQESIYGEYMTSLFCALNKRWVNISQHRQKASPPSIFVFVFSNVRKQSKKETTVTVEESVSSLAVKMSETRWFKLFFIFWKYVFWRKSANVVSYFGCVLYYELFVWDSMSFSVYMTIFRNWVSSFSKTYNFWKTVDIYIYIYI